MNDSASTSIAIEAESNAGERRQLTVLFCDLVGSTAISHQLDPEDWSDVLAEYYRTAGEAVRRFGGYVARELGDGLLVYFGWPLAQGDEAERAVRAGLVLVDAVSGLNDGLSQRYKVRLATRVGMHTGSVVVNERGEIFGETPNVAARVQGGKVGGCVNEKKAM